MWFLYDNIVAIQVAVVCGAFAWIFGGTVPSALMPTMPWLFALLLEVMVCFPQRHAGETTYQARKRVWRAIRRDPLTWVSLAFALVLLVPFFNTGLCPVCSYPEIKFDGASAAPPAPFMPFCVNRAEHLTVVMWFVPTLLAMVAVKHALLKRGKRTVLELIVWNGLALSAIGICQAVTGAQGPLWADLEGTKAYFFSTFGYPNMAGDYFTTLFGLSIGLWRWKVEETRLEAAEKGHDSVAQASHKAFWRKHLLLVPAMVFFFSAMMTLSRAAILLCSALAIIFYVHTFTCFLARMKKVKRFKIMAANLIVLVLIATVFFVFMSDETQRRIMASGGDGQEEVAADKPVEGFRRDFQREVATIDVRDSLDRISGTGAGQYHVRVAFRVWKSHPFFGCGGWGYKHFCIPEMTDEEYEQLQKVGGINVHNDYLQFLAEHGAVGFLLLVAMVIMLVWPLGRVWRALVDAVRFTKPKDQPPKPIAVFAMPAPVFCILATTVSTLLHAMGDCPMRSPAVLSLFFVSLAAMDGFLPRLKKDEQ